MPKIDIKQQVPDLDMNPMVDMAFLLVSFFMLTTTFKTEEPVDVASPGSHTEIKLPDTDVMTLTVAEDGRIFFNLDGKYHRERLIGRMAQRYELALTEGQVEAFALSSSFGLPMEEIPNWLLQEPIKRKSYPMGGIPLEEPHNQLAEWIVMARSVNPKLRIALKADKDTPYPVVGKVIKILVDNRVMRFSLVTEKEGNEEPDTR